MQNYTQNSISEGAVDRLISAHDGNMALLFLWLLRHSDFDASLAAQELCMTLGEVEAAFEKLGLVGLCEKKQKFLYPAEELPECVSRDIVQRTQEDPEFKEILAEAEKRYGRLLSSTDVKTLFGIYDHLALPPDVIFMLLSYCFDVFYEKYGSGRQPSMRNIEKEAYAWANREILTIEQADEFIKKAAERRSGVGRVKAELGITGRALTPTEQKHIDEWLDMGFDAETLAVAYDRTVTNTGSLKWNYMNKIVLSWHEKGIHSLEEIAEKDLRQPQRPQNEHKSAATNDELGRLRSIYTKVKNG